MITRPYPYLLLITAGGVNEALRHHAHASASRWRLRELDRGRRFLRGHGGRNSLLIRNFVFSPPSLNFELETLCALEL